MNCLFECVKAGLPSSKTDQSFKRNWAILVCCFVSFYRRANIALDVESPFLCQNILTISFCHYYDTRNRDTLSIDKTKLESRLRQPLLIRGLPYLMNVYNSIPQSSSYLLYTRRPVFIAVFRTEMVIRLLLLLYFLRHH